MTVKVNREGRPATGDPEMTAPGGDAELGASAEPFVIKPTAFIFLLVALLFLVIGAVIGAARAGSVRNGEAVRETGALETVALTASTGSELFDQVRAQVLPEVGVTLPIRWGNWLPQLVEEGIIDLPKFEASFARRGGLTAEQSKHLAEGSEEFITVNSDNSWFLIMVFWPLGLANHMDVNEASPINGERLFNFASTGGWRLGREENGGAYFNKYELIPLTREQEALVRELAENSYRPCCNNSSFYQDCNHGSGLLGLLELGASQGLTRAELARAALAVNSFWFPDNYLTLATYVKAVRGIDWNDVDAEEVLGFEYSSATGANRISQEVAALGLIPENASGAQCGVR